MIRFWSLIAPIFSISLAVSGPMQAQIPPACTQPLVASNPQSFAQFIWAGCPQLLRWSHDTAPRMSGPSPSGQKSVHGYVFNYYHPSVVQWLKAGQPFNTIPDGALIVKQMYADNNGQIGAISGWAIMLKQKSASFDGWFWGYVDTQPSQGGDGAAGGQFYDPNCVGCHASANTRELTFSALQNMAPQAVNTPMPDKSGLKGGSQHARVNIPDLKSAIPVVARKIPSEIPSQSSSKVIVGPHGPNGFVTNDVCAGCHDASNLAFKVQANMTAPQNLPPSQWPTTPLTNFSMWSEWSASLMGLSGRDPVFQAQRESETKLYPEVAASIDNECYTCHGVMGKRALTDQDPKALYTHAHFLATNGPFATVGALGRDGISCAVCHRVLPDGLGTPASFTGNFKVGDPATIFGPFDKVVTYPMQNAVGMTPKHGSAIQDPALCGSCHVVETPILDARKKYTRDSFDKQPKSHEQTTYLEWLNSAYNATRQIKSKNVNGGTNAVIGGTTGPIQPQTCQQCHMPDQLHGKSLTSKIANIEDNTYVDATGQPFPNTTRPTNITLTDRSPFRRHTLVGANVFVLEMFKQFGGELGLTTNDPNYDTGTFKFVDRFDLSVGETQTQVQSKTAKVTLGTPSRTSAGLSVPVTVRNLAGHKFPSGVGFRRAFVQFEALDAQGRVLWSSGATNAQGIIVDTQGKPLTTEFSKTQWQPHFNTIQSDQQVQIYETRTKDPAGLLTTSFLALATPVKDNRLMPAGWNAQGPYASWTTPVAVNALYNPGYWNGQGEHQLMYRIPVAVSPQVRQVRAGLVYQSLPPYYLKDRFDIGGNGPSTQTLKALVQNVNYKGTAAEGWVLKVASAARQIP